MKTALSCRAVGLGGMGPMQLGHRGAGSPHPTAQSASFDGLLFDSILS